MANTIFDKEREYFDKQFEGLELSNKTIASKVFENCSFIRCNFSETDFKYSKFCDCVFEHCNLSFIKIKGCLFSFIKFQGSKLIGVNWAEAAWSTIKIPCSLRFMECNLNGSTFFGVNLREAEFLKCRVHDVDFRESELIRANLQHSDFYNSLFVNSNLTEADFLYAAHYRINIKNNKITRAKFMLPEAVSLLSGLDIELIDAGI